MPEATQTNDGVFALFKMCVATLELHREFVDKNMHKDSNFRASLFMLEQVPFSKYVCTRYPWNKTSDTPIITGIPPDVLILAEFESLRNKLDDMKSPM